MNQISIQNNLGYAKKNLDIMRDVGSYPFLKGFFD